MDKNFEELYAQAVETLTEDDDLFMECIDSLDDLNGFADGYRAYDMSEIDDYCRGMSASDLLYELTGDFDIRDNYFFRSVYGLESCGCKEDLYRENVDESELLDNLIDRYDNLNILDADFDQLLQDIIEAKEGAA